MPYKLWFDDCDNVTFLTILAPLTVKDVGKVLAAYKKSKPRRHWNKVALVGGDPITRMAAKIALAGSGNRHDARFFKDKDAALTWLKEKNKKEPGRKKKTHKIVPRTGRSYATRLLKV